jgi:hypothetical protein
MKEKRRVKMGIIIAGSAFVGLVAGFALGCLFVVCKYGKQKNIIIASRIDIKEN